MPRTIFGWLLLAVGLAAQGSPAGEKLLLYPDYDREGTRRQFALFQEILRKEGFYQRYRLHVEFVPIAVTDNELLRKQLSAVVARKPDAIIGTSMSASLMLQSLTRDIPIVFSVGSDPVDYGLVASYARPGANLTGLTRYSPANGKRLEILKDAFPKVRNVGVLADKYWLHDQFPESDRQDAKRLGLTLTVFSFEDAASLLACMRDPRARRMDAWFVPATYSSDNHREAVFAQIMATRKPAIFGRAQYAEQGGLLSYQQVGEDFKSIWSHRLKLIWEGTPPGEIPVERPTQFELAVNVSTAQRWGLAVDKAVLKRADRIY